MTASVVTRFGEAQMSSADRGSQSCPYYGAVMDRRYREHGRTPAYSPSLPIACVGQISKARWAAASSSGFSGCFTKKTLVSSAL